MDWIFDPIFQKLGDFWTGLWAPVTDGWPLFASWGVFILIILVAITAGILIRLLLPNDWQKGPLIAVAAAVLAAIGWVIGRTTMYRKMQAKLDDARARNTPSTPKPPAQENGGGWFSGGKW